MNADMDANKNSATGAIPTTAQPTPNQTLIEGNCLSSYGKDGTQQYSCPHPPQNHPESDAQVRGCPAKGDGHK